MKRKLSLLLAVVLAMTMVMGIGVTAFAAEEYKYTVDCGGVSSITKRPGETFSMNLKVYVNGVLQDADAYDFFALDEELGDIVWGSTTGNPDDFITTNSPTVTLTEEGTYYFVIGAYKNSEGNVISFDEDVIDFTKNIPCMVTISSSAPDPDPDPAPTPKKSAPAHVHKFEWQIITNPTKDTDGLEGEMCSCGAMRNTEKISAYAYSLYQYAMPMINNAKSGQTITFEFGEWNSFPKSFMEKIAAKSMEGVTFVFRYKWNHEKQEITIPFGTAVDTQFDWYGPAKMAELYGMN